MMVLQGSVRRPAKVIPSVLSTERRFFATIALLYGALVLVIVLSIHSYFGNGWDPQIFAGAAHSLIDNAQPFDLYQVSRAAWGEWGYPYPPLYAWLAAPVVAIHDVAQSIPVWVLVRGPVVIFDLFVALLIYLALRRVGARDGLARRGVLLWLFNPITLYQTAIQSHQESAWLACVLAGFMLLDPRRGHRVALASLLMALALAIKQSAILFVVAFICASVVTTQHRWRTILISGGTVVMVLGLVSLPYLLVSDDYYRLVVVTVSNMPVQTQSAVVWLLGLSRFLTEQTRSSFVLLAYQPLITIGLAVLVSWLALRRGRPLLEIGLLMALLFILTSKKVMGYHYPLLLPFLLTYSLPRWRWDLLALGIIWSSWVIVSPYYAPWADPRHFVLYALLGTPNTLVYLLLFVQVWWGSPRLRVGRWDFTAMFSRGREVLPVTLVLTGAMTTAAILQPLRSLGIIKDWPDVTVVLASALVGAAGLAAARQAGGRGLPTSTQWAMALVMTWFTPLYVGLFTMTTESTRTIEEILISLGL